MNEIDEIARLRGDAEIARLRLEAANGEIEKLRLRVRFTDAEREALGRAVILLAGNADRATVGAVVGLLDRMS